MNPRKIGILFTAFFVCSSALSNHKRSEQEVVVSNDSSLLQPSSSLPNKFSSQEPTKNKTVTTSTVKPDLSSTKLGAGSKAASDSTTKKKLTRQQFRQKILAYCKRYLHEYGQYCVVQSKKSVNGEQESNNALSKLDSPEKREIKQGPTSPNPQAAFCDSYNMYCRRFLLFQPQASVLHPSNKTDPKFAVSQRSSFMHQLSNKSRITTSQPESNETTTSTPETSTTAAPSEPSNQASNLPVHQATAHLKTATQNSNVKINVTVEEMPQAKQPKQPNVVSPDSSKNSKNSTQAEDFDRRSAPLELPPPIPNAASDADALFLDSPLKSHVKRVLNEDLGKASAQSPARQDPPKILPVVVVSGSGANPANAAGTVAGLLGKAGGVRDPTCTADCTAPHCTTECKCANTHKTVEAKCNPPSNADLTSMCQAWYDKCQMYKPVQFA